MQWMNCSSHDDDGCRFRSFGHPGMSPPPATMKVFKYSGEFTIIFNNILIIFNATPSPPLPADGHIQFLWCIAGTLLWFWIDRRLFWKGSICSWWWMRRGAGWKNGSTIDLCCLGGIDHLYIVFLSLAGTAPIAQLWTVGRQEGATETIQIQIHIQRLHQPSNGKNIVF